MRGSGQRSGELFSSVDLEKRVRADHPLRAVRKLTDAAVAASSAEFAALYWGLGRPSVAPEKLLRAMLLQAFYALRSERQLIERLEYDLLFRWFVGLGVDDPVWDHSTFSKNRDRLLEGSARSTVPRPSRRRAVPQRPIPPAGRGPRRLAARPERPAVGKVEDREHHRIPLKRWPAFTLFLEDGRVCLSNNAADQRSAALRWTDATGPSPAPTRAAAAPPPFVHPDRDRKAERNRPARLAGRRLWSPARPPFTRINQLLPWH